MTQDAPEPRAAADQANDNRRNPDGGPPLSGRIRLLLVALVALAVSGFALLVCAKALSVDLAHGQRETEFTLEYLRSALDQYRAPAHAWPERLDQIGPEAWPPLVSRPPVDGWGRPLHYQVRGEGYRLWSEGRDGRPGGSGLDADPEVRQSGPTIWYMPTVGQFLGDPQARGAIASCLASGLLAGLISLLPSRPARLARSSRKALVSKLLALVAGSLLIAFWLAMLHLPSHH